VFSSYVSQVIRLYTGSNHIEMEFTVGPIPLKYVLYAHSSYTAFVAFCCLVYRRIYVLL